MNNRGGLGNKKSQTPFQTLDQAPPPQAGVHLFDRPLRMRRLSRWKFRDGEYFDFRVDQSLIDRGVFAIRTNSSAMFRRVIFLVHGPRNLQRVFVTRQKDGYHWEALVSLMFLAPMPFVVESPLMRGDEYIKFKAGYSTKEISFMDWWIDSNVAWKPPLNERVCAWKSNETFPFERQALKDVPVWDTEVCEMPPSGYEMHKILAAQHPIKPSDPLEPSE